MKVAIRTDASLQIGSGHVMRCLTLAERLREIGANVLFICRELAGNLNALISAKGFDLYRLSPPIDRTRALNWNRHASWLEVHWQDDAEETIQCLRKKRANVDWLVVDHYALDREWEEEARSVATNIMVIDDLADRSHDCDFLLDQNLYKNYETRYDSLVSKLCLKFLGPQYALLRKEFITARKKLRQRDGKVHRILIFFGGIDAPNLTGKMIEVIKSINTPEMRFDIVTGGGNPYREEIESRCNFLSNTIYHSQVNNMAELMAAADIAIGGGGSTTWERCFLGLPSIVVTMADNQIETAEIVSQHGASHLIGNCDCFDSKQIVDIFEKYTAISGSLLQMSVAATDIMRDFQGVDRLVKEMVEH